MHPWSRQDHISATGWSVFNSSMSMLECQGSSNPHMQGTSHGLAAIALAQVTTNCSTTPWNLRNNPCPGGLQAADWEASDTRSGNCAHGSHCWSPQGCSGLHPTCQIMLPDATAEGHVLSWVGIILDMVDCRKGRSIHIS